MHDKSTYLIGALILIIATHIPRRIHYLIHVEALCRRLSASRRAGLSKYIAQVTAAGDDFWRETRGLRGTTDRLFDIGLVLLILQGSIYEGRVSVSDAREVKKSAMLQVYYSLWAYPEALLCIVWRDNPHVFAAAALKFHWDAYLRTMTLCKVDGAPDCIFRLR